jgi:hypothetical protein
MKSTNHESVPVSSLGQIEPEHATPLNGPAMWWPTR